MQVSPQDQRLEYLPDRLSQLRRHGIGLLDVLFHVRRKAVIICLRWRCWPSGDPEMRR